MIDRYKILDIPINITTKKEVLNYILKTLKSKNTLFIATPNPEILLKTLKNFKYKKILQSADLNLPDGNGLIWAKYYLSKSKNLKNPLILTLFGIFSLFTFIFHKKDENIPFSTPIHGSDITQEILKSPNFKDYPLFLLGNKNGLKSNISELTKKIIQKKYPDIQIAGNYDTTSEDSLTIQKINQSKAKILLVGFGAPNQEIWISKNLSKLKNIQIAIGIGGTFDFICNIIPRAPKFIRKIGLEWLYRLYKQPKRIKRILNATVKFPYKIIKHRIKNPTD